MIACSAQLRLTNWRCCINGYIVLQDECTKSGATLLLSNRIYFCLSSLNTMDQAKLEQPHYKIVPSNIKNMVCTVRTTLIDDIYEYPPFFIHFINYFRRNLNLIFIDFPRHEVDWSAGTRAWFLWISLARYVWP